VAHDLDALEPDPDTVAAFRAGDLDALARLCERYRRAVWAVALTVLRDPHLAEDAAQETFLRVWRARASFDPARPFGPWLFTVARRTAVDVHRREALPHRGGHDPEQDLAVPPPSFEKIWEESQIRLALDRLSEQEREVVYMAHFQGMKYPDIAATLRVPLGTVKTRAWRAHRKLAVMLEHLLDTEPGEART
jgi:RNA polymerase sigma-70 factor (ECF subfamily)